MLKLRNLYMLYTFLVHLAFLSCQNETIFPELQAAVDTIKSVKEVGSVTTSKQVSIGERQRGLGFESLNFNYNAGVEVYSDTESLVEEFQGFLHSLPVDFTIKDKALRNLNKILKGTFKRSAQQEVIFSFFSPSTSGRVDMAYFTFKRNQDNDWELSTAKLSATFKTMPDWYIKTTTKSKSNLLSSYSSSYDEIVYVERGITQGDITELLTIVVPNYTGLNENLLR